MHLLNILGLGQDLQQLCFRRILVDRFIHILLYLFQEVDSALMFLQENVQLLIQLLENLFVLIEEMGLEVEVTFFVQKCVEDLQVFLFLTLYLVVRTDALL